MKEAGIPICIDEHQIGVSESVLVAPMGTEQLGVYIGEGMTAVPKRLAEKIWRWEFVDMGELLPDGWAQGKSEEGAGSSLALTRMKRQVTDVNTWVQCFAVPGLYDVDYESRLRVRGPGVGAIRLRISPTSGQHGK